MILNRDYSGSGYHPVTEEHGRFCVSGMDFGVLTLQEGEVWKRHADDKECAVLLVEGSVVFSGGGIHTQAERAGVFQSNGWAWHLPCGEGIEVRAVKKSELLIMACENKTVFNPKVYSPNDVKVQRFGEGQWDGMGVREVLTFFDHESAPYSKLVLGEVFALPGRWTSYPPHHHEQPEIYYYRMDKPQGFGAAFLEEVPFTIKDKSVFVIPGGMTHPQCVGAGYALYFTWIIKHLEGNPWTQRVFDTNHKWLMEENPPLWGGLPKKTQ
ncbi:MAG: 5-deoxy-glucuronate isomerase [Brevinema sp.]